MKHYNKLFETFDSLDSPRKDIIIAKINGKKNEKIADKLNVERFPTVYLFKPNDPNFPIKYDSKMTYSQIMKFINTFPVHSTIDSEDSSIKVEENSSIALSGELMELKSAGRILSPSEKSYFEALKSLHSSLKSDDSLPKNIVALLSSLPAPGGHPEKPLVSSLSKLAEQLSRIEKSLKPEEKEEQSTDSDFSMSWIVKYALAFLLGAVSIALYSRLDALEDVVKVSRTQ